MIKKSSYAAKRVSEAHKNRESYDFPSKGSRLKQSGRTSKDYKKSVNNADKAISRGVELKKALRKKVK